MSPGLGCLVVLTAALSAIGGMVLGFGYHDFLARRIGAWLPDQGDE